MYVAIALVVLPAVLMACTGTPAGALSPREYAFELCAHRDQQDTFDPDDIETRTWGEMAEAMVDEAPVLIAPPEFRLYQEALDAAFDAGLRHLQTFPPDEEVPHLFDDAWNDPNIEGPDDLWEAIVALVGAWRALDDDSRTMLQRAGCSGFDFISEIRLTPEPRGECWQSGPDNDAIEDAVRAEMGEEADVRRRAASAQPHAFQLVKGGLGGYYFDSHVYAWDFEATAYLDGVEYEVIGVGDWDCGVEISDITRIEL